MWTSEAFWRSRYEDSSRDCKGAFWNGALAKTSLKPWLFGFILLRFTLLKGLSRNAQTSELVFSVVFSILKIAVFAFF